MDAVIASAGGVRSLTLAFADPSKRVKVHPLEYSLLTPVFSSVLCAEGAYGH
jgi:hypothetical protein